MNIQLLFSTPERAKIVSYVLDDPDRTVRVSTAARDLKLAKGLVSSFFKLLEKQNIAQRKEKGISADMSNPLTKALKVLINLEKLDVRPLLRLKPRGIGLYGSWARGTNSPRSDVDIWITLSRKAKERDVALAQATLARSLGADVRLLVLDPQRLESVRKDPTFYPALVHSTLMMYGEPLESA